MEHNFNTKEELPPPTILMTIPMVDTISKDLRELYQYGHKDFIPLCMKEIELHSDKNHDYAGGGDPLGNFQRVSDILKMYPGFPYDTPAGVALIYSLKQLDAILWGKAKSIKHKVEGLAGRYEDVSVYAKLARIMDDQEKPLV